MKKRNSALRKTIGFILIVLTLISAITGCSQQEKGLEGGFYPAEGMSNSMICAFKSDKREFDVNDVTLTFCFGGCWSVSGVEFEREQRSYPGFDLYFWNKGQRYFIRHEPRDFVSDEFDYQEVKNEDGSKRIHFNHSEQITVPKEIFNELTGGFAFVIYGINAKSTDQKEQKLASISIWYVYDTSRKVIKLYAKKP